MCVCVFVHQLIPAHVCWKRGCTCCAPPSHPAALRTLQPVPDEASGGVRVSPGSGPTGDCSPSVQHACTRRAAHTRSFHRAGPVKRLPSSGRRMCVCAYVCTSFLWQQCSRELLLVALSHCLMCVCVCIQLWQMIPARC